MSCKTTRVLPVICTVLVVAAFVHFDCGRSAAADSSDPQISRTVVIRESSPMGIAMCRAFRFIPAQARCLPVNTAPAIAMK